MKDVLNTKVNNGKETILDKQMKSWIRIKALKSMSLK